MWKKQSTKKHPHWGSIHAPLRKGIQYVVLNIVTEETPQSYSKMTASQLVWRGAEGGTSWELTLHPEKKTTKSKNGKMKITWSLIIMTTGYRSLLWMKALKDFQQTYSIALDGENYQATIKWDFLPVSSSQLLALVGPQSRLHKLDTLAEIDDFLSHHESNHWRLVWSRQKSFNATSPSLKGTLTERYLRQQAYRQSPSQVEPPEDSFDLWVNGPYDKAYFWWLLAITMLWVISSFTVLTARHLRLTQG